MGYIENLRQLVGQQPLILNGSCGILVNPSGQILLQWRNEKRQRWGLPGGLMELGESTSQTLKRELQEETGLEFSTARFELLGVYSGADYFVRADNGDPFYVVSTAYVIRNVTQQPKICDQESLGFSWFAQSELPETIAASQREIIRDYFAGVSR